MDCDDPGVLEMLARLAEIEAGCAGATTEAELVELREDLEYSAAVTGAEDIPG